MLVVTSVLGAWADTYELYTQNSITPGEYIFVGKSSSRYFAMNNTCTDDHCMGMTEVSPVNDVITNPSADIVWTVTAAPEFYHITNGYSYLDDNATNAANYLRTVSSPFLTSRWRFTDYDSSKKTWSVLNCGNNSWKIVLSFDFSHNRVVCTSTSHDVYLYKKSSLTISSVGYATFCNAEAVTVPPGVEAYVWDDGLKKTYDAGDVIPAGVPVVLKGAGGTYPLTYTTGGTAPEHNDLRSAVTAITAEQMAAANPGNNYFYCLSLDASGTLGSIGFYWDNAAGDAFNLEAGKAYLVLPRSDVAAHQFVFDDETTDIQHALADTLADTPAGTPTDTPAYNLVGQRIAPTAKGLVIINGRKYLNN